MILIAALAAPAAAAPGLTLDIDRPLIEARLGSTVLRLRVDLDQRDVVELNPDAAARAPVAWLPGYAVDVGRVRLAGRQASVKLVIGSATVPVILAEHGRACCAGADGAIGVDLLPYDTVRFVRANGVSATTRRTARLNASEERGLTMRQPIGDGAVDIGFSLAAGESVATAAGGALLAKAKGGRLVGAERPLVQAFGVTRRVRTLQLDRTAMLAGFAFPALPVRLGDFGGGRTIPAAPEEAADLIVTARRAPQEAWPLVRIGRDRLDRCAAIEFAGANRTLTLDCAFDAAASENEAGPSPAPPVDRARAAAAARVIDRVAGLVERRYWNREAIATRWPAARARWEPRLREAAGDRPRFYALLNAMLDELGDSHLYAIDPDRLRLERSQARSGAVSGYGFTALPDDAGRWQVLRIDDDGPAAQAGVQVGWTLLGVDGGPVDVAADPAPGDRAELAFEDEAGQRHLVRVAAAMTPELPVRRSRRLAGDVLLIALDSFDPGIERWLDRELATGPRAVVLDLRENAGGEAGAIAAVAGRFFGERRVLVSEIGQRTRAQMTRGSGGFLGPLAVLVGPRSASGAEALAALVAEAGRGSTVGERTAGHLTSATHYRLPDGGQLSLAEADVRTGGGARLEGVGFTPALIVKPSLADLRAGRDPVLDAALARLR